MKFQHINTNLNNYSTLHQNLDNLEKRLEDIEIKIESIVKSNILGTQQGKKNKNRLLTSFLDLEKFLESQLEYIIRNNLEIKPEFKKINEKIYTLKKRFQLMEQIEKLQNLSMAIKKVD